MASKILCFSIWFYFSIFSLYVALATRIKLNREIKNFSRPKTWKKQVEEETEKIGLKKEDALRRDKWRDGVRAIAEGMG